jgi:hypothetical protein
VHLTGVESERAGFFFHMLHLRDYVV